MDAQCRGAVGTPGGPNLGPFIRPTFGPQGPGGGGGILGSICGKLFGGGGAGAGGDSLSSVLGLGGTGGGAGGLPGLLVRGGVMDGFSMPGSAGLLTMPGLGVDTTGAGLSGVLGAASDAASMFAGFFAGGGDVLANRPAIVGERGPELFMPRTAGHIIPNHQLGGGGDTHHWHIDARGATDPAAVHAAIMRAAPSLISASVQAVHHAAKRSPSGR